MSAPLTVLPFPDPPATNMQSPSMAQPQPASYTTPPPPAASQTIDAILAQALIPDEPVTSPSSPPPNYIGSSHKESLPTPTVQHQEVAPIVEVKEHEKLPEEVEGWLQKLDQAGEIKLPEPITHDGDVLLADTEAQVVKEKIVLPLSQSAVQQGMKSTVDTSARWLAEWCIRLIKMFKDGVKYAPESVDN